METPREELERKQRNRKRNATISLLLLLGAGIKYNVIGRGKEYFIREINSRISDDYKDEYSVEEIIEAVDNNDKLTTEEKEILKEMECIIEDNPFILSRETYYSVSNVYIEYETKTGENDVAGYYDYPELKIGIIEDDEQKSTLRHEDAHCIFTNEYTLDLPIYFIEGVTELLINEYFMAEPYVELSTYPFEISMVKVLCNMVGPDKVLEAYTVGDMDIIKDELVNRSDYQSENKEKAAKKFLKDVERVFYCYETGEKIPESAFENMFKYLNEYFINHYDMNSTFLDEYFYYRDMLMFINEEDRYNKYFNYMVENGYYARPYFSSKLREENGIESIKDEYNKQKTKTAGN